MLVARRYVIAGRVQGVGFRWFTTRRRCARRGARLGAQPRRRQRRGVAEGSAAPCRSPRSRGSPRPAVRRRVERFDVEEPRPPGAQQDSRSDDHRRAQEPHPSRARLPQAGHPLLRRHHAPAATRKGSSCDRQHGGAVQGSGHLARGRHREPRLHSRAAVADGSARVRPGPQAGQAPVARHSRVTYDLDTAPTASRCTATRSRRGRRSYRRRPARDRRHGTRHGRSGPAASAATSSAWRS